MTKTLKHKRYPEFRNYEIVSNGLKIEFKTNDSYNEQVVKFEEIGFEEQITQFKPSPIASGLFISVFFNILFGLIFLLENFENLNSGVLSGITGAIIVGMAVWGRQLFKFEKVKYIKGQINLSFWYFRKYRKEVDEFIVTLKSARRDYFREKYLKINENEDNSLFRQKLSWLKSLDYLTESEYQEWLTQSEHRKVIKGF